MKLKATLLILGAALSVTGCMPSDEDFRGPPVPAMKAKGLLGKDLDRTKVQASCPLSDGRTAQLEIFSRKSKLGTDVVAFRIRVDKENLANPAWFSVGIPSEEVSGNRRSFRSEDGMIDLMLVDSIRADRRWQSGFLSPPVMVERGRQYFVTIGFGGINEEASSSARTVYNHCSQIPVVL